MLELVCQQWNALILMWNVLIFNGMFELINTLKDSRIFHAPWLNKSNLTNNIYSHS